MIIEAYGVSDIGQTRELNEDFIVVDGELGLYVVCDGIGGRAAGEVASEAAARAVWGHVDTHRRVLDEFDGSQASCDAVESLLRMAIQKASNEVFQLACAEQGLHGMGTTCVALIVVGGKGFMGHVGDSRMYLVRDGQVWQLSQDHTFFNESVCNGRMTIEEAGDSPWADLITRAVGLQPSVLVDTLTFDVLEGDTVLLCSDGLSNYLEDLDEIGTLLSVIEVADLPARLVNLANARGGGDNISAVVVRAAVDSATREHDVARKARVSQSLITLRHIVLFKDLADSEIVRLFSRFKDVGFEDGDVVIREGEDTDPMYVIVEGEVRVEVGGKAVATLGRGAHVGEMSLLSRHPRSATVIATASTKMLMLQREDFNRLLREDTALAAKLLYTLAQILCVRLEKSSQGDFESGQRKGIHLGVFSPFRRRS